MRDHDRLARRSEQRGLSTLRLAGVMHDSGVAEDPPLDQHVREPFQHRTSPFHPEAIQRPKRPHDVWDAARSREDGGGNSGIGEQRVDVHEIEVSHATGEPTGQRPRDGVKARLAPKVPVSRSFFFDRAPQENIEVTGPVVVCCGDVHVRAGPRQASRECAHGHAWPAPAGTDRGDDMQHP